ncbi:MAG: virulence factor MviN [Corynebacteriales bacterium]|nr:virulence factor MviN [Mycobacteriales bacterium]
MTDPVDETAESSTTAPTLEANRPAAQAEDLGSTKGLASAAGLIAGLTVLARMVGFGRIFVFSWAVGITTLGTVYLTINTLPNIVFEIVAGGALSAVVVPLISAALTKDAQREVNQLSSALLTWAILTLTILTAAVALFAHPIANALLGSEATNAEVDFGARLLIVFAPQLVLYGVGIVLTGILQAHHRFAWPALAPMLSSLTVMAAYVVFALSAGRAATIDELSLTQELILSVGTTAAVAVLTLCLLIPLRGTGVRIRPTLKFPAGAGKKARALLGSGIATVGAQQLSLLVVLILLQPPAPEGAVPAFNLAQTVFLLPWAVLAVPAATSAFPRLSASHADGDHASFNRTLSITAKAVVLLCAGAAAVLIAAANPSAELISAVAAGRNSVQEIAFAIAAFAPGLVGYGLLALLSRALYATGAAASTAAVTVGGWLVVIVSDIVLALVVEPEQRIAAVAIGNSVGMTIVGVGLAVLIRRQVGREALHGLTGTTMLAIPLTAVAALAGLGVGMLLPQVNGLAAIGSVLASAGVALAVFVTLVALIDRDAVRPVLERLRRSRGAATKEEESG